MNHFQLPRHILDTIFDDLDNGNYHDSQQAAIALSVLGFDDTLRKRERHSPMHSGPHAQQAARWALKQNAYVRSFWPPYYWILDRYDKPSS